METYQIIGDIRKNVRDVNDCGGRLGPQIERMYPDLRNAIIKIDECSNGDIIFVATDGFHDNFDPSLLDYQPTDVGFDVKTWKEAAELEHYQECKKNWMEKFISSFFKSSYGLILNSIYFTSYNNSREDNSPHYYYTIVIIHLLLFL
jgi:hypothetical protein